MISYNSRMNKVVFITSSDVDLASAREETFMGKDYFVIPVVAIVEGVLHAANATMGAELALAQEFGKVPQGWNGRPLVMNHPQIDGDMVSANQPAVLEDWSFGFMFNTRLDGHKLKTEAWIDTERVKELGGEFAATLERARKGDMVEVSVGIFTESERQNGTFNGRKYTGIWRNVVPDHLAFLSKGSVGACSVEDGCGAPRVNMINDVQASEIGLNVFHGMATSTSTCGCEDPNDCQCHPEPKGEDMPKMNSVLERAMSVLNHVIPNSVIDRDARMALAQAITAEKGPFSWLIGFTQDTAIYQDAEGRFFQVAFNMDEDGNVEFTGESEAVRLMTRIVPVNGAQEDVKSNEQQTTSTEETSSSEDQTEKEVQMSENSNQTEAEETRKETEESQQTETKTGANPDAETENTEEAAAATSEETQVNAEASKTKETNETVESYISKAPSELREVLEDSVRVHKTRKHELIGNLKKTGRCEFSDESLMGMSIQELEKLTRLAQVPSYEGQAGPRLVESQDNENGVPTPPNVFEKKSA